VSLRRALELLSSAIIEKTIRITDSFFRKFMGTGAPRIAVAGLNPHAGEGGLFGDEETAMIAPAIASCRGSGIDATGPYPPDTIFYRAWRGEFDVVVAMTHDHGLIPLKLVHFEDGVNVTMTSHHPTSVDTAPPATSRKERPPGEPVAAIRIAAAMAPPGSRRPWPSTDRRARRARHQQNVDVEIPRTAWSSSPGCPAPIRLTFDTSTGGSGAASNRSPPTPASSRADEAHVDASRPLPPLHEQGGQQEPRSTVATSPNLRYLAALRLRSGASLPSCGRRSARRRSESWMRYGNGGGRSGAFASRPQEGEYRKGSPSSARRPLPRRGGRRPGISTTDRPGQNQARHRWSRPDPHFGGVAGRWPTPWRSPSAFEDWSHRDGKGQGTSQRSSPAPTQRQLLGGHAELFSTARGACAKCDGLGTTISSARHRRPDKGSLRGGDRSLERTTIF
jgi:hypothetical protein